MHYEGVPVSSYYVIAEFASVRIIFGATVSAITLKTQFPIETCGKTSKFLQRTLIKCCFVCDKILRSSDCVAEKKKEFLWTI